jgi:uncharacterized RDD family membrane protein YckC
MHEYTAQLYSLGIHLLLALAVWWHYRRSSYPLTRKYDTFGPRFCTGFVDTVVLAPIGFGASWLLFLEPPTAIAAVVIVGRDLLWLAYTVLLHAKYGQTVGKRVCYVKVVDFRTEGPVTFRQAALRESIPLVLSLGLVVYQIYALSRGLLSPAAIGQGKIAESPAFWLLTALPLLWFLAEVITMLTNEKRRALHDYLAGTVVLRTNLQQQAGPVGTFAVT